jgi:hypothetical protein
MLNVVKWCWRRVLPASFFMLVAVGCAFEPVSEGDGTPRADNEASGEVASVTSPLYCVAHWVLVQSAFTSCYIDKDTHFLYYTLEVNGADLYHDANGCFPNTYKKRRLDNIQCTVNVSLDTCLGRWSQAPLVSGKALVRTNYCPSPLVVNLPVSTGEPPLPPWACDPAADPVGCDSCHNLCSYTQICAYGVCNEDPYWRDR